MLSFYQNKTVIFKLENVFFKHNPPQDKCWPKPERIMANDRVEQKDLHKTRQLADGERTKNQRSEEPSPPIQSLLIYESPAVGNSGLLRETSQRDLLSAFAEDHGLARGAP
jgi:hypothetical protein